MHEASLLPCSRERFTSRQITSACRFSSVNSAVGWAAVSTSIVARRSGSVIGGRSTRASIGRSPSCCQIRSYSRRTRSSVGCAGHLDARAPQELERRLDGEVEPAARRVELEPHRRHGGQVDEAPGAAGERGEAGLGGVDRAGQELALGAAELERERQRRGGAAG